MQILKLKLSDPAKFLVLHKKSRDKSIEESTKLSCNHFLCDQTELKEKRLKGLAVHIVHPTSTGKQEFLNNKIKYQNVLLMVIVMRTTFSS